MIQLPVIHRALWEGFAYQVVSVGPTMIGGIMPLPELLQCRGGRRGDGTGKRQRRHGGS